MARWRFSEPVSKEIAIRAALRPRALLDAGEPSARLIEEFWTPVSHRRADLAVIGAELHGYEIKSEADTLRRLPRQVEEFSRIFDRCTAVVAEKHKEKALEFLPAWWGLMIVEAGPALGFRVERKSQRNRDVDLELVVRLLWRAELEEILTHHGVEPDRAGGRSAMWQQVLSALRPPVVCAAVRSALRARDQWLGQKGVPRLSNSVAAP